MEAASDRGRKLVKELTDTGFVSKGGKRHEVFVMPGFRTEVQRHNEIGGQMADIIRKQEGLR